MILPDFVLPSRVNQCWQYSGIDSFKECLDKNYFKQYPHPITYNYNSRGFRDQEWPDSTEELKNAIWCIGDSFTVGLGSPIEHTWPWLLQKQTGRRIINVSMDGASNSWIARKTATIQKEIKPKNIAVMWSFLHRREDENQNLNDEQRRISHTASNHAEDGVNFFQCIKMIESSGLIQLIIPEYARDCQTLWENLRGESWPRMFPSTVHAMSLLPDFIQHELKEKFKLWEELQTLVEMSTILAPLEENLIKVSKLDLARDGFHFDLITAQWIVNQIINELH
jgi:hypothetical protein